MGFNPIPILASKKRPPIKWERFQTERSTDKQWKWWANRWPTSNIAIITGRVSGVFVIDQDAPDACPELIASLPRTATAVTKRGRHFYFRYPSEETLARLGHVDRTTGEILPFESHTKIKSLPGVDIKAEGGYVLVPPSVHPDGPTYVWEVSPFPDEGGEIAECPDSVLQVLLSVVGDVHTQTVGGQSQWRAFVGGVTEGNRNEAGLSYCGRLIHDLHEELWETAGWSAFLDWNAHCTPPQDPKDLRATFDQVCKKERAKRRLSAVEGFSEVDLLKENPAPPDFLVSRLLAVPGLTLLMGHPKSGKSVCSLQIARAVAGGEEPFGPAGTDHLAYYGGPFVAQRSEVLYLALEDSKSRLNDRLKQLRGDRPAYPGFFMYTTWPSLFNGGLAALGDWLDQHPTCKLVVIDTLIAFIGEGKESKGDVVSAQYRLVRPLFDLARDRNIAVLVLSWSRKGKTMDPTDAFAGTNGVPAGVDTMINIVRDFRSPEACFAVLGRDVEPYELYLAQRGGMRWALSLPKPT